jgi:hypothetical protein
MIRDDVDRIAREAVEWAHANGRVAPAEVDAEWPDRPRLPGSPDPQPLPIDALPPAVRAHVVSVAGALQVPQDLPHLLALGTFSAALAGRVEVEARPGWREPVGLYVACIMPPATRKSPTFAAMTAPLRRHEEEAVIRAAPKVLAATDVLEVAEKRLERTKADVVKGKAESAEVERARLDVEDARRRIPPDGRLLAGDITPEAMVIRMASQDGRLAVMEPEPGPLQLVAGRYSDTARLDELKKAWSGETLLVDRVGRPPVRVRRPALTLALLLQPGVLEALQNGHAFRTEGVMGRFLWCRPPHGLGRRLTGPDVPTLDRDAERAFARIVRMLLEVEPAEIEEDGTPRPHVLHLEAEALDLLHGFEAEVEGQLGDGARLAEVRDWAGKAVGQALRVAALLELAARAADGRPLVSSVSAWAMGSAIRNLRTLMSHALVVLHVDQQAELLTYVLRRAIELPDGSTLRDLYEATKGRAAIESVDDLRQLVEGLEDRGCIRLRQPARTGPGRPPSPTIEIHPLLSRVRSHNSQNHGGGARSQVEVPPDPWEGGTPEPSAEDLVEDPAHEILGDVA